MVLKHRVVCGAYKKFRISVAVISAGLAAAGSVIAQPPPPPGFTQLVTTLEDHDDGNCSFQDCTLREAINAANANPDQDYIEFDGGLRGPITLQSELPVISQKVEINNFTGNHIAILGTGRFRLLKVEASPVSVSRVDFVGGRTALNGAGITVGSTGVLTMLGCEISQNFASDGAGIFNGGKLSLLGCSIWGNDTSGSGAGLLNLGTATLTNCTFSGNNAGVGGQGSGGGIYNTGTLALKSVTITENNASEKGGGVRQLGTLSTANSIFAKNSAPQGNDVFSQVTSLGYNLIGDSEDSSGFNAKGDIVGTASIPVEVKLEDLDFYGGFTRSHRPAPDSPVLDQGNRFGLTSDQRGKLRPVNLPGYVNGAGSDGSDIGSFEVQSSEAPTDPVQDGITLVVNTNDDKDDGACTLRHCSLREAIKAANKISGANVINFAIPGTGVQTIAPTKDLPNLTGATTIDGSSQPGFKGKPLIELSGVQAGATSGLRLAASNCVVKSLIINSFGINGITIFGSSVTGCKVEGCYIGTDATGKMARPNLRQGILLNQVTNCLIGGPSVEARNILSGNGYGGLAIYGSPMGTLSTRITVQGNYIGTDVTGTVAIPNNEGVRIDNGGDNVIGGTQTGARNLISGNSEQGILVVTFDGTARNNVVQGNYIGCDKNGRNPLGNGDAGVYIADADKNLIGGASPQARNIISGNFVGVRIAAFDGSARENRVQGNYFGTDKSGKLAVGTAVAGVVLQGCKDNLVGGSTAKERNLICGGDFGLNLINVAINGIPGPVATGNRVQGNSIGLGVDGVRIGNTIGMLIRDVSRNFIGGSRPGEGNLISGNFDNGITLTSDDFRLGTFGNAIQGNIIGLDASGTVPVGNLGNGISMEFGVFNNKIGGTSFYEGNLISGNLKDGMQLIAADYNQVLGNYIGTDAFGEFGIGNGGNGIRLINSFSNQIGGSGFNDYNVVSWNALDGIKIDGGSEDNAIQGNIIGADAYADYPLGNGGDGIEVSNSFFTLIGGPGEYDGNLVVANGESGIAVTRGSQTNGILNNLIADNEFDGVTIDSSSQTFVVTNGIFNNGDGGVYVLGQGAVGNSIVQNEIADNRLIGIDLEAPRDSEDKDYITPNDAGDADTGPNNLQNYPVLREALTGQKTLIKGALRSLPNQRFNIELYAGHPPHGAIAQADEFLGAIEVETDANGRVDFTFNVPKALRGQYIIATATNETTGDTSEFSLPLAVVRDQSKPEVAILKTSGITFGSTVQIEGTAKDTKGITSVKVLFERRQAARGPVVQTFERTATLGQPKQDGTVTWKLNAVDIPPGFYTVRAIAENAVGNTTTSSPGNLIVLGFGR